MQVLIVKIPINDEYGFLIEYENEECWVFLNDETPLQNVIKEWKRDIEEFPKLYQYLEYIGGQLVKFEEVVK